MANNDNDLINGFWHTATELANKKYESLLGSLDKEQQTAVFSKDRNIAIVAPPGSGKTLCLVAAIAHYQKANPEDRIVAITFTNVAKDEMGSRLFGCGIDPAKVKICTIDKWCKDELYGLRQRHGFELRLISEEEIEQFVRDYSQSHFLFYREKFISQAISYISGFHHREVNEAVLNKLLIISNAYQDYKEEHDLYDFGDFPKYLHNKLEEYGEIITDADALFVDEFQDVDMYQLDIFEKSDVKKRFFIGDQKQGIYAFRGADGHAFDKLDPEVFTFYHLKHNYRSYQEIMDYADNAYGQLGHNGVSLGDCRGTAHCKDVICSRGKGASIWVFDKHGNGWIKKPGAKAKHLSSSFQTVWQAFVSFMDGEPRAQILCRTNKQINCILQMSGGGYSRVSTIHNAKGKEFERVLMIDTPRIDDEDKNVAYVARTRAKNELFIINWAQFQSLFKEWWRRKS